jgi:subtilisin-like proprotein convertase family protein
MLPCALLVLATVAMAEPEPTTVMFVDGDGAAIGGCPLFVRDDSGQLLEKIQPEVPDSYVVLLNEGGKYIFELDHPDVDSGKIEVQVPRNHFGPLIVPIAPPDAPQLQPANDLCDAAVVVPVPSITAGTTVDATLDQPPAPDCIGFPSGSSVITTPGVWYEFTGTGNFMTASLCTGATNFDSKLGVFCLDCAEPTCVDGNDDSCGLQSETTSCTQLGRTYRVLVHGFGGQTGPFELEMIDSGVPCDAPVDCTPPAPTGACCDCDAPPFNCEEMTQADCDAMGGQYAGDGIACVTPGGMPVTYSSMPNVSIPDNDSAGVSDTITVAEGFAVGDVNVGVTIDHTFIGDLVITLTAPSGDSIVLWDRACSFENNMDVVLDDEGGPLACAEPTVGVYTPVSADGAPLAGFQGLSSMGDWTLNVSDNAGLDTGTFIQWTLELDSGTETCPDQNNPDCFLCDGGGECPDDGKVTLCHFPPGNPANAHTIEVGAPAVDWHLVHGDVLGECMDPGEPEDVDVTGTGDNGPVGLTGPDKEPPGDVYSPDAAAKPGRAGRK